MKRIILIPAAALLLLATACGGKSPKESAKDFGTKIAGYAANNQLDSLRAIYPAAAEADSLTKLSADDILVEDSEDGKVFTITFGNNVSAKVKVPEEKDGKIKIKETKGLFAYKADDLDFAKKTGAYKDGMTDEELAPRMKKIGELRGKLYTDYMKSAGGGVKVGKYKCTYEPTMGMEEGKGYYPITNTTDRVIKAGEYTLHYYAEWMYAGMMDTGRKSWTEAGKKDIPAGGTINIPLSFTWHYSPTLKSVTVKPKKMDEWLKDFKATGKEYDEFAAAPAQPAAK